MQTDSLDQYKIDGNANEPKYWYLMASQNRSSLILENSNVQQK